ncbi:MAG: SH3 domain-containing protein, partial [Planctomycetes bacterium]|nr:SH3 domain-containing protein [Planctomycetota bacterium]
MTSPFTIAAGLVFSVLVFLSPGFAQDDGYSVRYCRLDQAQDLWSGPSSNFKKVREAPQGLLLKAIGEKGDYYRVLVPDGFQCYIAAGYLEVDDQSM